MKRPGFLVVIGKCGSRVLPALALGLWLAACATSEPTRRANSAMAGSMASDSTVRAEARPGLGTSLGGTVSDNFVGTDFYRRDEHHPDKIMSFNYSDDEGARAMAELVGKPSRHHGSFDLADGCLRAALILTGRGESEVYPLGGSDMRARGYESTSDTEENTELPWYEAGGKVFVSGVHGGCYSIRLENRSRERVEVVVSVDGLDVRNGAAAAVSHPGYVIAPHGVLTIPGMKSGGEMKAFTFGSVKDSQAAKVGGEKGARNVGVVGVALYVEDQEAARRARANEGLLREGAQAFSER